MSVKNLISELFAAAAEEGNSAVIAAIAPFIDLSDLANKLDTEVRAIEDRGQGSYADLFSDTWRKSLTRTEYSADEISKLTSDRVIQRLPGYLDFIVEIALGAEVPSRQKFVSRLLRISAHQQALTLLESLPSLDEIKVDVQDDIVFFDRLHKSKRGLMTVLGSQSRWSRNTIKIMNMLGVEQDPAWDIAEHSSNGKDLVWTRTRYDAQIDFVGDIVDTLSISIPTVSLHDGEALVREAVLGEAFVIEHERVNALGGWHRENFPNHYPALAKAEDITHLESCGVITLQVAGDTTMAGYDGQVLAVPVHRFEAAHGDLSAHQINMATSLLSRARVTKVREALKLDASLRVVLVPPSLAREASTVPAELTAAVRYHRPEVLRIRGSYTGKIAENLDTRLYLAGIPSGFSEVNLEYRNPTEKTVWLKPEVELHSSPELIEHFNEPGELDYLFKVFTRVDRDTRQPERLSIGIFSERYTLEENFQAVMDVMDLYRSKVGDIPFRVAGPLEFLQHFASKQLGIQEEIRFHLTGGTGHNDSLYNYPRLRAALGEEYSKCIKELGEKPEDWVAKAVRSQDDKLKERAAGMLDRLPLEEVALLATTDAKAKFLLAHFDFVPVAHLLTKKVRDRVLTTTLETDLGL